MEVTKLGAWKTRPPGSSPWLRGLSSILLFSRCILGEGEPWFGSNNLNFLKDLVVTFYLGKVWCCVVERVNRSLSLPPLDSSFSSSSGSPVLSPPVPTASVLTCIFQIASNNPSSACWASLNKAWSTKILGTKCQRLENC